MVDVSQLVSQMHETLSNIHSTISSLSALDHEQQLDDLEQKRAAAVAALQSDFSLEAEDLARKRQAQKDALAEQRRREDEEREARRRKEDEDLQTQLADEDRQRHDKLDADTRDVEESTDSMMGNVEEEAKRMLEEGKVKLAALEERRRELNRLIDEQLQIPLPSAPSRRKPRDQALPEMATASNPVDIFEKRNDNGDGDRDAIPALKASATAATIVEQEPKTNVSSTVSAEPSLTSAVAIEADANNERDIPFHENQKYLQEDTLKVAPESLPTSEPQVSDKTTVVGTTEVTEPSHTGVDEKIGLSQPKEETQPCPDAPASHESPQESEPEHEEPQTEVLLREIDLSQHSGSPAPTNRDMVDEQETPAPVEVEISHESQVGELNNNEPIENSIHDLEEDHEDQDQDVPEEGFHEQDQEEVTFVSDASPAVSHQELPREEPLHDEPVQEQQVHEEPSREAMVHEASLPEGLLHDEFSHEKPVLEEPGHEESGHWDSAHEESAHEGPVLEEPIHEEPVHEQSLHEETVHETSLPEEPTHDNPTHDKPTHDEPAHDEPAHEEPIHEEPNHGESHHEETNHGEPMHEESLHKDLTQKEQFHDGPTHEEPEEKPIEQVKHDMHSEPDLPTTDTDIPSIAIHTTDMTEEEIKKAVSPELKASHENFSEEAAQEPNADDEGDHDGMHEIQKVDEVEETFTESVASEHRPPEESEEPYTDAFIDHSVAKAHEEPAQLTSGLADEALSHTTETVDYHKDVHENVPASDTAQVHETSPPDSNTNTPIILSEEPEIVQSPGEIIEIPAENHTHPKEEVSSDVTGHAQHAQDSPSHEFPVPEAISHDSDHPSDVDSTQEIYEAEETHENNVKGVQSELTEQVNATEWHYQEPYVAPETYAYPYAVTQEYVDYGSSYYASAQQSLDPSPVFHEAFGEPILDERMVFDDSHSAVGEQHVQSLDQELGELDADEGTDGEEEQTIHADTSQEVQQEPSTEAENAATMHGQDDLFDDDSEGSAGSLDSEGPTDHGHGHDEQEHDVELEHASETDHPPEISHKFLPHDADMPQTPTTIVDISHNTNEEAGASQEDDLDETIIVTDQRPVTPDASTPVASQFRGLANSRHAPQNEQHQHQQQEVPMTPPRQTASIYAVTDEDILGEAEFLPRDVTHVPWRERGSISSNSIDATPGSVRSQATLSTMSASSSFSSPSPWSAAVVAAAATHNMGSNASARAASHQDDPFIRSSWSGTPSGGHEDDDGLILGRGKSLGRQLNYNGPIHDAEQTALVLDTVQKPLPPSVTDGGRPKSIASSSPSSLFQRMRSIFEPPNGAAPGTNTGPLLQSVTAVSTPTTSLRDPYPATRSTSNRLVEEGFIRGVSGGETTDDHDDDEEDDQINEKSSLLQAAPATKIVRVVQQVTLDEAEFQTTTQDQKQKQRAASPFRLAWYRAEGWREQLRASGDIVESCRWTWRVDDQLMGRGGEAGGKSRGGRVNRIPQIVATVPSAMRRSPAPAITRKATTAVLAGAYTAQAGPPLGTTVYDDVMTPVAALEEEDSYDSYDSPAAVSVGTGGLVQVPDFGSNPSNTSMYIYVPEKLAAQPAIIVAIHYCTGTAQAYYANTPYAQLADQKGFIVIYPSSPYDGTCWDVSSPAALTHNGGGDSNSIANMVTYTLAKYKGDPSRVFVTGTSSGAMMTNVMAAAYPEMFAAGIVYSGVPAGCFYSQAGGVNAWNSSCADGQIDSTPAIWAGIVDAMDPAFSSNSSSTSSSDQKARPKMQIYHGSADAILYPPNYNETIKQWCGVFGFDPNAPDKTQADVPQTGYTTYTWGAGKLIGVYAEGVGHTVPVRGDDDMVFFGL
ncbi:hypothetical protein SBRCBS47491_002902 [Sporothrix bragantina]|uniref:Carboxylic ester hydrolase n=1 Tax=Sporothrix bragantina TaxID=671064 RepID=A0ABP0BAT1_9PEZI